MKLLSLWESKSNLFDACVISKLQSPNSSMTEYKTNLMNTHLPIVTAIQQQTQITFEKYVKILHILKLFRIFKDNFKIIVLSCV